MPRKPTVPSYRLHKPSGQAVVTLSGRDHYLGLYDTPESREAYRRLIARWLDAGRAAVPEPAPDLTVNELVRAYLAHARGYYQRGGCPTTQYDRVRRSVAPAVELYGSTPARDFGPSALKAVRAEMVARGWSRRVVNQRVGCLVRVWKWATAEELVGASSYHGLRAVECLRAGRTEAPEAAPVPPAPEAAVAAVRARVSPTLRDLIDLQLLTAMRPGEALSIRPGDVDRSGPVWRYRPRSHKTQHHGHERVVYIGPRAQALLAPYLLRGPDEYCFSPREAAAKRAAERRAARKTPVQPSQLRRGAAAPRKAPGERYGSCSYSQAVRLACRAAGVARWHPHQLRHNAATRLVQEVGWDLARVILGHRTLDATRVYAEDSGARAAEAVARVG